MFILRRGTEVVEVMEDRPERRDYLIRKGYEWANRPAEARSVAAPGPARGGRVVSPGIEIEDADDASD